MLEFVQKYKWWILAIIIIIILIILIKRKGGVKSFLGMGETAEFTPASNNAGLGSSALIGSVCAQDAPFPLMNGSKGKQVGALQKFINATAQVKGWGINLATDCSFGNNTEDAVEFGINKIIVSKADYDRYNVKAYE